MQPYNIIKHPIQTEKAVRLMESENKLIFIVRKTATKIQIKKAVEELFKVKVIQVNILIQKNEKKAYVKLAAENKAIDVASQLGLM